SWLFSVGPVVVVGSGLLRLSKFESDLPGFNVLPPKEGSRRPAKLVPSGAVPAEKYRATAKLKSPLGALDLPATTILPSAWMAMALAPSKLSLPKSVSTVPGKLELSPKVVSMVPLGL